MPTSKEEQVQKGQEVVKRGTVLSKRVAQLLHEARNDGDIIKTTCLNDKLTQINANLRNAQERLEGLKEAADSERQLHEYTVLSVLRQKFQVLDQEASQCVGQDLFDTGTTRVTTEVDAASATSEGDPSQPPIGESGAPTGSSTSDSGIDSGTPTIPPPASGIS
ncbi:MAG: hypothetical protein OEZ06_20980 [Myxococcales bacterium]|nr:hypothetical protein [Myxococcales bacterium]